MFDEWEIEYKDKKIFKEINIIINENYKTESNINYEIPTFFVNFFGIKKNEFQEPYGITSDKNIFSKMFNNNIFPVIYTAEKSQSDKTFINLLNLNNEKFKNTQLRYYSYNSNVRFKCKDNISSGSAIGSIISLSSISNQINVYGWDSYLKKKISSMNKLEVIIGLISKPKNNYRRWKYIAPNLINYIYAYKIKTTCKNIVIKGNLSDVQVHEKIMLKLEKLIYI